MGPFLVCKTKLFFYFDFQVVLETEAGSITVEDSEGVVGASTALAAGALMAAAEVLMALAAEVLTGAVEALMALAAEVLMAAVVVLMALAVEASMVVGVS